MNPPDATIVVMGSTGTGKSAFIQLVTKDKNVKVGHGVHSETSDITLSHYFEPNGRSVRFVDTPGFDDSRKDVSDAVILHKISAFLDTEYKDGKMLNGIIYLHRITDPRIGGIAVRNVRMLSKLCGPEPLKNVVIVTTRWDEISEPIGIDREMELMNSPDFFQPLIVAGARSFRHDNTFESGRKIMDELLDNKPIVLQIQQELAEGKSLQDTAAGSELQAHVNELIDKQEEELQRVRKEMREAISQKDMELRKELESEREKLRRELDKWEREKIILQESSGAFAEGSAAQHEDRSKILDCVQQESAVRDKQTADLIAKMEKERRDRAEYEAKAKEERRALVAALEQRQRETAAQKEEMDRKYQELLGRLEEAAAERSEISRRWRQELGEERERANRAAKDEADKKFEEMLNQMPKYRDGKRLDWRKWFSDYKKRDSSKPRLPSVRN